MDAGDFLFQNNGLAKRLGANAKLSQGKQKALPAGLGNAFGVARSQIGRTHPNIEPR